MKVSGRKALLGRTDLEMEIANQCGLLIASAIIYYNASIHSYSTKIQRTKSY
jgi:hypothetical protein